MGTIIENDPKAERYLVEFFVIHPNYSGSLDDAGLIKLSKPILYNNVIRPICLPESNFGKERLMSYRHCVLSGFGYKDGGLQLILTSTILTRTRLKITLIFQTLEILLISYSLVCNKDEWI